MTFIGPLLSCCRRISCTVMLYQCATSQASRLPLRSGVTWAKGKFQRRDFRLDVLIGSAAFCAENTLFAPRGKHEIFPPTKTYPPMTIHELAALAAPAAASLPMEEA